MSSDTSPSEEGGYPTAPDGVSGGGAQIKKRRLMKHDSGSAAVGILMTLSPKHAIDTAVGPFLGKGLPTGLGLADGIGPQGPSESLCHCVTSPFKKGGLTISGSAAVGILMTLSPKHAIDTAVGPFLGKGLPTGLGLADGIGPQGLPSSRLKAQGVVRSNVPPASPAPHAAQPHTKRTCIHTGPLLTSLTLLPRDRWYQSGAYRSGCRR